MPGPIAMKLPTPAFVMGTRLYLRINSERTGMLTGLVFRPGGTILYLVTWDEPIEEKEHFACELSEEKGFGTVGEGVT